VTHILIFIGRSSLQQSKLHRRLPVVADENTQAEVALQKATLLHDAARGRSQSLERVKILCFVPRTSILHVVGRVNVNGVGTSRPYWPCTDTKLWCFFKSLVHLVVACEMPNTAVSMLLARGHIF